MVGGSLFFRDKKNLYGRYWGCQEEYDCLHFECCYYQGIEYCIKNNLEKFDSTFLQFLENLPFFGSAIICTDSERSKKVFEVKHRKNIFFNKLNFILIIK